MSADNTADNTADNVERRFPRRFLMAASAAVAAVGITEAITPAASAAPASTTWKLGGTSGVATDGSNFIGPTNVAPLIFKTKGIPTSGVSERMRLTASALLGLLARRTRHRHRHRHRETHELSAQLEDLRVRLDEQPSVECAVAVDTGSTRRVGRPHDSRLGPGQGQVFPAMVTSAPLRSLAEASR